MSFQKNYNLSLTLGEIELVQMALEHLDGEMTKKNFPVEEVRDTLDKVHFQIVAIKAKAAQ